MLSPMLLLGVTLWVGSCQRSDETDVKPALKAPEALDAEVALKWNALHLKLLKTTAGFSPVVASRAIGYMGLTLYEAVVPGSSTYQSLAGQLNGLNTLPKPELGKEYDWAISANAAEALITKKMFDNTSATNKTTIDSLETALNASLKNADISLETFDRSIKLGQDIATALFEWSKTDGGHEGYKRNFPADYKVPVFPGAWQPTENGQKIPMQPTWGKNRPFMASNSTFTPPAPLPYSTDVKSQYFAQYLEVYTKNKSLTDEEKEIAVWWSDNPGNTFTPPGHSYSLAAIAARTAKANLMKTAEAFARTGIAVADAFICCWKCKYVFSNERPYTFVRYAIDPAWVPFWPAPPFPGYMSGHATQSAATAEVLTEVFGNNFTFTDDSHVGRAPEFGTIAFKARKFNSFYETAEESAWSRFLGGIHPRQDNEVGLREGKKIGRNVNTLKFKR
ncbi:MAG: vanadium-dependent haloperoxidase [Spirosomataceae bacterium]